MPGAAEITPATSRRTTNVKFQVARSELGALGCSLNESRSRFWVALVAVVVVLHYFSACLASGSYLVAIATITKRAGTATGRGTGSGTGSGTGTGCATGCGTQT